MDVQKMEKTTKIEQEKNLEISDVSFQDISDNLDNLIFKYRSKSSNSSIIKSISLMVSSAHNNIISSFCFLPIKRENHKFLREISDSQYEKLISKGYDLLSYIGEELGYFQDYNELVRLEEQECKLDIESLEEKLVGQQNFPEKSDIDKKIYSIKQDLIQLREDYNNNNKSHLLAKREYDYVLNVIDVLQKYQEKTLD